MSIKNLDFYVGLVHYPIKNKIGEEIATAVTNLDIHDIARLSKTFGFKNYYIITPIDEQKALVDRIKEHWMGDYGKKRNNIRTKALSLINVSSSIEIAKKKIEKETNKEVKIIATTAKNLKNSISFKSLSEEIKDSKYAYLLIFGTGWGLTEETLNYSNYILEPISYDTNYNHLSVRSAVSIIMDRLYNAINNK
jgi:hypothetical protein